MEETTMTTSHPSIAEARWRILRSALVGDNVSNQTKCASIHRFGGWDLLRKAKVDLCCTTKDVEGFNSSFMHCQHLWHCSAIDGLYYEILARQCLSGYKQRFFINCSESLSLDEINELRERLGRQGILAKRSVDQNQSVIAISWSYSSYIPIEYKPCQSSKIVVRERMPRKRFTVRELSSHLRHDGVDNTGQTCVWDSECTLTHCLLNDGSELRKLLPILSHLSSANTIIELGVGMAGIAGLALASTSEANVLLTDGHPDAVENNQINIMMNKMVGKIHCERLLWSVDINDHREEGDIVLCSDCTHFREHHSGLMITLAHLLKINRTAILCQPQRSNSLDRFLMLCESFLDLWEIRLVIEPALERLHQKSLLDPTYDPNLHCPCIVALKKLRALEAEDRRLARQLSIESNEYKQDNAPCHS